MNRHTTNIEVQRDNDGGWIVLRDRIVDGHFSDLVAANDYAHACAHRAQRAGLQVDLRTLPSQAAVSDAAA